MNSVKMQFVCTWFMKSKLSVRLAWTLQYHSSIFEFALIKWFIRYLRSAKLSNTSSVLKNHTKNLLVLFGFGQWTVFVVSVLVLQWFLIGIRQLDFCIWAPISLHLFFRQKIKSLSFRKLCVDFLATKSFKVIESWTLVA